MRLASVQDVIDVIRIGNIDEIETSIESALLVSTAYIETRIRTSFTRKTRYDIFAVKDRQVKPGLYEYHWRLENGYVDSEQTFTVRAADTIAGLTASDAENITSDCVVDYERGTVSMFGGPLLSDSIRNSDKLAANFVRVDYTSGFQDDSGFFEDVPSYLQQAAVLNVISQLNSVQPTLLMKEEVAANYSHRNIRLIFNDTLHKHIRYFPKHDNPVVKT